MTTPITWVDEYIPTSECAYLNNEEGLTNGEKGAIYPAREILLLMNNQQWEKRRQFRHHHGLR